MTGFARHDGACGDTSWFWELRSVNGRGLDVRLRLPPGMDTTEAKARALIQSAVVRGNVSASLSLTRCAGSMIVQLNEEVLGQVLKAAEKVRARTGGSLPDVAQLLSIKGVLETVDAQPSADEREGLAEAVLESLSEALCGLVAARGQEGTRLGEILAHQLSDMERLIGELENNPARDIEALRLRLSEQVARLMDADRALDPARLHQEAALLATRLDIEEEVKRLRAHVAAVRELLSDGGAVGRRLDFLAQEFNREANTVCSKSGDPETSRAGLELKAVIDQMREQVQNIE